MTALTRRRAGDEERNGELLQQDVLHRVLSFSHHHSGEQPDGDVEEAQRFVVREVEGDG